MSTTDGARTPEQDGQVRVVQIYPRLSQDTAVNCLLQISATDTAKTVIHNTVATLGLDSNQGYSLLEVRNSRKDERLLDARHYPLQRVLLWPPEAQKWHPQSQGYYFILQQQQQQQQATSGEDEDKSAPEQNDDLCNLETLTEENVLQVLRQRFHRRKIYTYARNILIAVNPNKVLPVYYNPKYVKMYENQPLGKLSPHIFAMADVAFNAMLNRQVNQCIVISGESGSGKTESSSYLIHCLIALSQKTYSSGLERTILGAGPVLEAFGNAKTAENNNSSRFGKFIQLNYLESGVIRGAVIEKYLLEKNRLVSRDKNQRNYHVFYYLLAGASKDEQDEFHLLKPQDYLYLKQKELCLDDEDKLGNEYKKLHQAMEMVGFLPSTKKHIFSILSAILHLGNVTYTLSEDSQDLEVGPADVLSTLCDLLKVKKDHLVKALTKKRIVTAKATIVSPYTLQKASKIRDSMAESLYSALFDWIVLHINHSMLNRRDMEDSVSCLSIGVLDLFGFENLQINSLEQLCINFASEKLQYYINQNLFKLEQEEYVSEGITWQNINYTDNSGCVELISRKSTGLFDLLDKESSLPQATDETLLDKLKQHHQDNPLFVLSPNRKSTFTIQHFAGRVNYDIKDFREKNTEHMRPEVVSLLRSSERAFVPHLVASNPIAQFRWGILRATIRILTVFKMMGRQRAQQRTYFYLLIIFQPKPEGTGNNSVNKLCADVLLWSQSVLFFNLMDLRSLQHVVSLTAHDQTSKSIFHPQPRTRPLTMSTQFQTSLRKLMETIEKAEPFFIFCVRSNAKKKELQFDDELVLQQIRYTGLMQMVQVQKSGYSAKYTFKEFAKKFRILLPKQATVAHIKYLFERMELDRSTYQIGKTKVFLKEKERQLLQDTLNKTVMYHIVTLQRWFRVCLLRLHFLQRRDASKIIEVHASVYASPTRTNRNPTIRISRATRAIDINASVDRMITNPKELRSLDEFLGNQVTEKHTRLKPQISYKDLMKGYHNTVSTLAGVRQEAEVPLVVNLFQSVLDGFIRGELKRMESDPTKVDLLDHLFNIYQVNVTQTCDACASYIRGMEKAYICSACNLICHKKCLNKIETHCSKRVSGSLYFGVQVSVLISDTNSVPKVMEMLLLHVELNGLYTEGIYRKSGSACRAKELQQILDTDPESVCLENYPIHTITGLVKRWLRELPDPLMPFSLYSDFLHAVELPEKAERIRAIYQTIDELPPANYSTLERLIFHLVRVAKEEEHNKMSPGALAIVFAPCILRTPDSDDPLLCMKDVSKTTLCVEILICEQFRRYTEKMRNIKELEYAEALAVSQLKLKRQNTIAEQPSDQPSDQPAPEHMHPDETEKTLIERIKSIKQEKVDFVIGLPDLEQENSDNDNLESMSLMSLESEEDIRGNMEWEGQ
uniref:Myosin IXb n=1 Tax=Anabas testudineus TaxID=64144 RepID=A0A7N6FFR8_ANATE